MAILNGVSSSVTSIRISVPRAGAPVIYPGGGTVKSGTIVTLRSDTTGSTIYYTTDGSLPDPGSEEYQGSVIIRENMTLKAIAVKDGYTGSAVSSASFTVEAPPANEVSISLGSVSTDAGAVASVPVYIFSDSKISRFQITLSFDKDAFENYVTVTPAEGVDPSKLFSCVNNGTITLLYTGAMVNSGEICTVNYTSLASKANTEKEIRVELTDSFVTTSTAADVKLSAMNGSIKLGAARIPQVSGEVVYTAANGNDIKNVSQAKGEIGVSIGDCTLNAGAQETFANVYLAIYDQSNRMVSVDTWRVNLSDPAFMFIQTIKIPQNIQVGAIKIMLLSDQMVPLMAANELAH